MIYNLTLHLNDTLFVSSALVTATVFVFISLVKEKRDERKRA
ncbi:hypothetical protein SAMN06269301_1605 [Geobacter sp. DSM 9736]|nr:hypothetical protein SAMN06269301_1605 [Geobacter sp. DSM 9736]